jgi:hypothetical protein
MLANLIKKITREGTSDSELERHAQLFDEMASHQLIWLQAEDYLNKAKKRYSRLQQDSSEHLLEHARYAEYLTFSRSNNFELKAQFNYSKRIYQREGSEEDLYNLALHAEEAAFTFRTDVHQIEFLEYARNIFLKLDKKEDVKRLAQNADQQAALFENPVSQSRFLSFAVNSYRQIGDTKATNLLKTRETGVRNYITQCLLWGVNPQN